MLNLCLLVCHTILNRECMCETMNPGPFFIIRNTFPTTFQHHLHSAILKSENKKHLYFLHSHIKTTKISSIIVSTILSYLFTTIAYLLIVLHLFYYHSHTLCLTTIWWGWGHKTTYFVCSVTSQDFQIFEKSEKSKTFWKL